MATAQLIDLSNYDALLVQSTDGRVGTPDGNVYFDTTGKIEFIRADELALVTLLDFTTGVITMDVTAGAATFTRPTGDFTVDGFAVGQSIETSGFSNGGNNGVFEITVCNALTIIVTNNTGLVDESGVGAETMDSGPEDNPLTTELGIKFEAIYAFENQERRVDEELRKYNRWTSGTFKFGGAYNFINSRKPSTDSDRSIIRGSGWNEYASDGGTDRIYFGNKGLSNIEVTSQPYNQLILGGVPSDYAKLGQIDEAVQVFGSTANTPSDAGAGDFDTRTYEAVSVRTFGNTYDRKETTTDLGIAELGGYSTGFAVNEGPHLTTGTYTLADVYGGVEIAPWDTMGLEELDTPVNVDEFAEAAGDFTWVLNNPGTGTNGSPVASGDLDQMVAFLDALAQTDDDINDHAPNVTNGKRVDTWYSYNSAGKVVTESGADALGLYMYNVPTADQQRVVFTADDTSIKSYSFSVSVEAEVGATAKADTEGWFHGFFAALYNTSGAVTILDSSAVAVKGLSSAADANNKVIFSFDYTGDTVGGPADTDKDCVFICEGDGGATQAKTLFTITQQTTVAFSCAPGVENNV